MASTSAVAVTKKYDVFISFRGEDTRGDFTSHLHAALRRNRIETYIDHRIQKGDEVWAQLVKAINESGIFLVILSKNYASSSWCLNELVELLECKKQGEDVHVIPVFYKIDPSQVRKQTGSYDMAFRKHKEEGKVSEEKMQKWKDALYQVANISGFHSNKSYGAESDLIEDIIKDVLQKLNQKCQYDFRGPFIYDENYTNIESLLKFDSKEVRVIGIWGMGGIGKTRLATAIFHKVSFRYEDTCFLENATEESKSHGPNYVWSKVLSNLLREDHRIDTPSLIPSDVIRRLRRKKVFVVLDDVNTSQLLETLIGKDRDWLGAGSRVIVTTRDKHVLMSGNVDQIHEVKEMNFHNSLKLFCLYAFDKTYIEKGYEELSRRAMDYAKGNPLALKDLGSFLRSKSKNEWDSALGKLKKIPNKEIQSLLRLSYDGLDDEEKTIFLDIACFFKGKKRDHVTKTLNACDFSTDIGIRSLLDKSLITITPCDDCIDMHDLIQEMGRGIVREESIKNPGQRSRLWDREEVYDVLTNNKGTCAVEGIWLDMTQTTNINLSSKVFKNMPNLRFLVFQSLREELESINSVDLPKGLEYLPRSLRKFEWNGYPLKILPSTFCPEKLFEISLTHSNVEKLWHGVQNLPNLQRIDLYGSKRLVECPNMSRAPNLKKVEIGKCESLSYLDPSILSLPKLEMLYLSRCTSLKSFSGNFCSKSLQRLYLQNSGLNKLPPSVLRMRNLKILSSSFHYFLADLPENFASQIMLFESSKHDDPFCILHKVLPSPCFRSLTGLILYRCKRLCEIPDNISLLSSLKFLTLYSCAIIRLPESIKHLPKLEVVEVSDCKMLQSIPQLPQSTRDLHAWACQSLQTVLVSMIIEPSKTPKRVFLLPNCTTLDQDSYDAIFKDSIDRIELGVGAKPPPPSVLENEQDASTDNYFYESAKICCCLPAAGSSKIRDWFHCQFADTLVTIEFPPNLLGFILYLVLSPGESPHIACCRSLGCECSLETSQGERTNIKSFFLDKDIMFYHHRKYEFMTDHIFLWYDAPFCKKIMKVIKENSGDTKLTFKFFTPTQYNQEALKIKECGFRWIYPFEEGGKFESNREIHQVNANVVPNKVEDSDSESNEQEETEELRHRIEELLHIGLGGGFM